MSGFRKQTPSEFLKQIIGKPVVVKLNSGVDYRGKSEIGCGRMKSYWALIGVSFCRCSSLFGRLYEHCTGADRRVCEWTGEFINNFGYAMQLLMSERPMLFGTVC